MKIKTKSLKTRIFALVAVVLILGASCLPCLAFDGSSTSAVSLGSVPIYLYSNYTIYYGDDSTYSDSDSYPWGAVVDYNSYPIDIYRPESPQETLFTYMDETGSKVVRFDMNTSRFGDLYPDYFLYGFDVSYEIDCGNFLIDTLYDEFSFDISSDERFDYAIACAYTVLDGDTDTVGDVQYFTVKGVSTSQPYAMYGVNFDLCDYLSSALGAECEIFISALSIAWKPIIEDGIIEYYIYNEVVWEQSDSVRERNFNGARIDYSDTPLISELNYYNTISQFFENLGIDKYKDSFVNYTADYTSWLGNAVGGFLNMELFPFFSIGGILLICVAIGLVGYFLKVFMGG